MTDKIKAKTIWLHRGEGPISEAGRTVVVEVPDVWKKAHLVLLEWSDTAPRGGGYDKCDFKVTWEDNESWEGRCDIKHWSHGGDADLYVNTHIKDFAEWEAGRAEKPWCGSVKYAEYLRQMGGEEHMQGYRDFLEKYSLEDETPVLSV
jgi:hypothetical protein